MVHHPTFERIVSRVEEYTGHGPKGGPTRKKGMCPAHADSRPSLSIRWDEAKKVVGVTCWSGCTFEQIVASLDLTKEDFREKLPGARSKRSPDPEPEPEQESRPRRGSKKAPREKRNEVDRYRYCDADGKTAYFNIRFDPKEFTMAGPDGVPGQLPKNLVRYPYRLPEVVEAVRAGNPVYWVEGEKDVASVEAAGGVATCLAGGVNGTMESSWFPDYFEGADLIVVADRDKPGEQFARRVAQAAVNHVSRVRLAQAATPQPKSDVTDHLDAGYRLDQLTWMPMRSVRRTRWTMAHLMATKPEPVRWVFPGVIPEGLTLLVGPPKVGKSWWNLDLITALATGRFEAVFGWGQDIEPCPSLYLALEDPMRRVHNRMQQVSRGLGFRPERAGEVWLDLAPIADGGRDEIERWLEKHPNARAVMVDVLAKVRGDGEGQTMYQADYEAVGALKEIADSYGVGVIVTHHDRKKGDDDFVNQVSGTKGITGAADTILLLSRDRKGTEGTLKVESRDVEACTYNVDFNREFGRWQIMDRADSDEDQGSREPKTSVVDQLQALILTRGESELKDLARMIDTPLATVKRAAVAAEERGELARTHNGLWYVPEGAKEK